MTDINNKIAFVTGAASGIGLALCKGLLDKGAKVMMSDIDADGLEAAYQSLGAGENLGRVVCDVADEAQVEAAAHATIDQFGKVHLVFNNAGVSLPGRPGKFLSDDWRWINDINLMGVVYGVETFLPLLLAQGEGGHIINTASMAGHIAYIGMGPYFATKFAVVGYSEALFHELSEANIGVSCLCPTWVVSNIHNTADKSPGAAKTRERFKQSKSYLAVKDLIENGMSAEKYAALSLKGVEQNRLYVFNDPEAKLQMLERHKMLVRDFDANLADLKEM
jgi:NADP-dependent 3-hydroxy acid dehydrogenase YdfG